VDESEPDATQPSVEPSVDEDRSSRRRRRPTGTPPPLPRSIGFTGKLWLIALFVIVLGGTLWLRLAPYVPDHIDTAIARTAAGLRSTAFDGPARWINISSSHFGLAFVCLVIVVLLIVFGRIRHLVVFMVSLALVEVSIQLLAAIITRPRPYGVTQIGGWEGYASPSLPIAARTAVLIGIVYTLVVPGRARWYAKLGATVFIVLAGCARVYLGVDAPFDVLLGAVVGVAIPVTLFRTFTPNDVFPVSYGKRGKAAHLDVTGRRGEAIRAAVHDQLGLQVLEIEPVGLEGSGGSTPLRMKVIDEETGQERSVFAKLYARNHVRADRWYKLGRTMLYGSLEDETPFGTVRRFVEYEDYALRLLGAYGFATPEALGVAEITPEREYLIAMEFFDGAVEIGEAEVTEHIVDEGLQMIRRMWDVGLAHRDIKPANLMVRDDELKVIDVFFVQVRPSPWRQAVDLANMMLVLALRSDAGTVYRRALDYFTPDELAEAFAAARGIASPTQLQHELKRDGRDLLAEFRAMAPTRPPIGIQRWSVKRVLLILAALALALMTVQTSVGLFFPHNDSVFSPTCDGSNELILIAQAVPTADHLPCIDDLPIGWAASLVSVRQGRVVIGLAPAPGDGASLVTVTLTHDCEADLGGQQIDTGGACITYVSELPPSEEVPSFNGRGLALVPRSDLVSQVEREEDLPLCGTAVDCP
jgi:membrane-associated phospholipid phosphatase/serine/threonine-protein kinase RIO1